MATTAVHAPQVLRGSSSLWSSPSSFVQHSGLGLGLRLPVDSFALKSSFFNGGSASSLAAPLAEAEHKLTMRVAAKGAYVCKDCGYIYSDRKPFEKLPDDFYCPVCGAPKRRFKPYDIPVAKNANQVDVRKARKAQLKQDDSLGNALPVGIAVGILVLIGTYLYVNSQF